MPSHERVGKLEGAILDAFRIKPAVGATVDVLEEHAPHRGTDCCTGLVGLNGEDHGRLGNGRRRGDEQGQKRSEKPGSHRVVSAAEQVGSGAFGVG
jgi:hypothetical protein